MFQFLSYAFNQILHALLFTCSVPLSHPLSDCLNIHWGYLVLHVLHGYGTIHCTSLKVIILEEKWLSSPNSYQSAIPHGVSWDFMSSSAIPVSNIKYCTFSFDFCWFVCTMSMSFLPNTVFLQSYTTSSSYNLSVPSSMMNPE